MLSLSLHQVRTQGEDDYLQKKKESPPQNRICQRPNLGLLNFQNCEKKCLLFKPPSLWCLVIADVKTDGVIVTILTCKQQKPFLFI